jgi:hypothetical protein
MADGYQAPTIDGSDHPLKHVPQDVLDAARSILDEAADDHDVDQDMAHPIADAVVMQMLSEGYVTWPGRGDLGEET